MAAAMSLVLVAAMLSICVSECEQPGIHYHWDDTHGNQDYADYETPAFALQYYVNIWGSFRTSETGSMPVEGFVDPTGASAKGGKAVMFWDFSEVARGSKSGDITNWSPSVTINANVYCYKYFRYQWKLSTDDFYFQARLRFRVQPPGYSGLFVLNTEFSDTCEVSGCTDLSYSREPDACQPPPTTSRSPSPTASKTPSPTASTTPSPSQTRSRSAAQSASASASSPFTTAWNLLRRPRRLIAIGVFTVFWDSF
jgi:hypothetical protein